MPPQKSSPKPDETISLEGAAIGQLNRALQSALEGLPVRLEVLPTEWKPLGVGQYISLSRPPVNSEEVPTYVQGVRLGASVAITVTAKTPDEMARLFPQVSQRLMEKRISLREQGILSLRSTDPPPPSTQLTGERSLSFQVIYEFLGKTPPSEGVIQKVSIQVSVD